jgi:hypothetical protein
MFENRIDNLTIKIRVIRALNRVICLRVIRVLIRVMYLSYVRGRI